MQLSKRLSRVASFVTEGNRLADIGTDHGYIPIYLVKNGKVSYAYAMDINKGPLERAKEHILEEGLETKIETRLSNGLDKLYLDEADTVLIAGMGGALTIDILERGKEVLASVKELVLSPHSEWMEVRMYLCKQGYEIVKEDMLIDADKYYVIYKAINNTEFVQDYSSLEYKFGRHLLNEKNEVLKAYLEKEKDKINLIMENLKNNSSTKVDERMKELKEELEDVEKALLILN